MDCYSTGLPGHITQARFVEAFYTTRVFKLERFILAWAVNRHSTDAQAVQLAQGNANSFAAWSVEQRSEEQLLLCDLHRRTRSWLMAVRTDGDGNTAGGTRLYFGSAVVPVAGSGTGAAGLGTPYRLLLGFHKVYSKVLLRAARARLLGEAA